MSLKESTIYTSIESLDLKYEYETSGEGDKA